MLLLLVEGVCQRLERRMSQRTLGLISGCSNFLFTHSDWILTKIFIYKNVSGVFQVIYNNALVRVYGINPTKLSH